MAGSASVLLLVVVVISVTTPGAVCSLKTAMAEQRPLIALVMPHAGFSREILMGFNVIARTMPWEVRLFGTASSYGWLANERVRPDVLVVSSETLAWIPQEDRRPASTVGVNIDLADEGITSIIIDDEAVGREAAAHLVQRGFTFFAAFSYARFGWSVARAKGFREAIEAAGARYIATGEGFRDDVAHEHPAYPTPQNLQAWLRTLPNPTAILACCDSWGTQLAETCAKLGLRIPEDLALVGVDNEEFACEMCNPPLSSVVIPWRRVGSEAALLVQRILSRQAVVLRNIVKPGTVMVRRSSDMLAIPDADVVAALRFIHASAGEPIGLGDVLREVPVYRQKLENAFRKYLGRTIMEEVRRVRVEHAKRLLAGTALPPGEVADRSGFADLSQMGKALRRHVGMSPTEYRQQFACRGN